MVPRIWFTKSLSLALICKSVKFMVDLVNPGTVHEFILDSLSSDLRERTSLYRWILIQTLGTKWTWVTSLGLTSGTNISSMLSDEV